MLSQRLRCGKNVVHEERDVSGPHVNIAGHLPLLLVRIKLQQFNIEAWTEPEHGDLDAIDWNARGCLMKRSDAPEKQATQSVLEEANGFVQIWYCHSNMIDVPCGYDSLIRHHVGPLLPLRTNDWRNPQEKLFSQNHARQSE